MKSSVSLLAPQQQNPNFFPIGEGFGFFIFFGNDNSGLFPTAVCSKPYQQSGLDSEWRPGGIFENCGWRPWVRRLREMPFQKQLERHFLSFDIRHLLSPKLLPDGTERIRYIRIGHRTGNMTGERVCPMYAAFMSQRKAKSSRLNPSSLRIFLIRSPTRDASSAGSDPG